MLNYWIQPSTALPDEDTETLIATLAGDIYVSRFETRKVEGNDNLPYGWRGPGPFSFFGWQVSYWMPLPPLPVINNQCLAFGVTRT